MEQTTKLLAHFTNKEIRTEDRPATTSYDLNLSLRKRRLCWLGHILRMNPNRLVRRAVVEQLADGGGGNILMDAPKQMGLHSLTDLAFDDKKRTWRAMVRALSSTQVHTAPARTHTYQLRTPITATATTTNTGSTNNSINNDNYSEDSNDVGSNNENTANAPSTNGMSAAICAALATTMTHALLPSPTQSAPHTYTPATYTHTSKSAPHAHTPAAYTHTQANQAEALYVMMTCHSAMHQPHTHQQQHHTYTSATSQQHIHTPATQQASHGLHQQTLMTHTSHKHLHTAQTPQPKGSLRQIPSHLKPAYQRHQRH